MKNLFKLQLAGLLLLANCALGAAHAGIIQDSTSDSVGANLGGLEWLEFTHTVGLNSATVDATILNAYDGGGWRYASTLEAETLLTSLMGGVYLGDGWNTQYYAGVNWFQNTFGNFAYSSYFEHYFMYDRDSEGFGIGRAGYTALNSTSGWLSDSWGLNITDAKTVTGLGGGSSFYAHMLVRDLSNGQNPSTDVPEPTTLTILALSLMGLLSRRLLRHFS